MTMIQLGLSLGMLSRASGQEVPPSPFLVQPREFTRDRAIFDTGAQLGRAVADIPLSGTTDAPDGTVIEARAVSLDDGGAQSTSWAPVAAATAGGFSGTLPVPLSNSWFAAEIRAGGGQAARMTSRFAAGHVWALWGQSNLERQTDYDSSMASLRGIVAAPGNLQIVHRGASGSGVGSVEEFTVDSSLAHNISPTAIDIANALNAIRPGEKFRILWQAQGGTAPKDTLTAAAEDKTYGTPAKRDWAVDLAVRNMGLSEAGQKVGLEAVYGWTSWNNEDKDTMRTIHPLFLGHGVAGAPTDAASQNLPRLFDARQGGVCDWSYSRFAWVGPHGSSKTGVGGKAASTIATHTALGTSTETVDKGYDTILSDLRKYMGDANNPETLPWKGSSNYCQRGAGDELHMAKTNADGMQRLGRLGIHSIAQMLGWIDAPIAELDWRQDEASGAYADFAMLGHNLTTERRRRAATGTLGSMPATIPSLSAYGAAIAPEEDHRTEVMGFTINGRPAKRAEIVAGAGPSGEDIVRVWPNAGSFTYKDLILYGQGVLPGHFVKEDYADAVWANYLVTDTGAPAAILPAMPVQHQGRQGLDGTLAGPDAFTIEGNTWWHSGPSGQTIAVLAGGNARSVRFEAVMAFENTTQRQGIGSIHATNSELFLGLKEGLTLVTPGGNINTPDGVITYGTVHEIAAVCDLTNNLAFIEVDGVRLAEANGTLGMSGNFTGSRSAIFCRRSSNTDNAAGRVYSLKLWLNDAGGTGTASKVLEGGPATVNADPWRVGDAAA